MVLLPLLYLFGTSNQYCWCFEQDSFVLGQWVLGSSPKEQMLWEDSLQTKERFQPFCCLLVMVRESLVELALAKAKDFLVLHFAGLPVYLQPLWQVSIE